MKQTCIFCQSSKPVVLSSKDEGFPFAYHYKCLKKAQKIHNGIMKFHNRLDKVRNKK